MFLQVSDNGIINLLNVSKIKRGEKGEIVIWDYDNVPITVLRSFDSLISGLRQHQLLLNLEVVDTSNDADSDADTYIETVNLTKGRRDTETKDEYMVSERDRHLERQYARDINSENSRQTTAKAVFTIITQEYHVATVAETNALTGFAGFNAETFEERLQEKFDFLTFDENSFTERSTVGDVIDFIERHKIAEDTLRVQEEDPIDPPVAHNADAGKEELPVEEVEEPSNVHAGEAADYQATDKTPTQFIDTTVGKTTVVGSEPEKVITTKEVADENPAPYGVERTIDVDTGAVKNVGSHGETVAVSENDIEVVEYASDEISDDATETEYAKEDVSLADVDNLICEELDRDESEDDVVLDLARTMESYLEGTAGTLEDIVDAVNNDYDIDVEDSVTSSTTLEQLVEIIKSKIAV